MRSPLVGVVPESDLGYRSINEQTDWTGCWALVALVQTLCQTGVAGDCSGLQSKIGKRLLIFKG
jgi:hypothetical protein